MRKDVAAPAIRLAAGLVFIATLRPAAAELSFAEFLSVPAGASVYVDGVRRGATPLQLTDFAPGAAHHVRVELKDYETVDEMVKVQPSESVRRDYELESVKGLLLVSTDPSGAEIFENGYSLGTSPRLIANLETKDRHLLVVKKPGYQDSRFSVKFDGRRPLVQHVKLVKDSGTVSIRTNPDGAETLVNGISRGASPVVVEDVVKGLVTVELRKEGYKSEKRELRVAAGDEQDLMVELEPLPGSVRFSSVPAGARFYLDDLPLPSGDPCVSRDIKPGTYKARAEMEGYAAQERNVEVANGGECVQEFRLENIMGILEIRTSPPGATVWIDGKKRGVTASADAKASKSDVLRIENIPEGEHEVRVSKLGYLDSKKALSVESKKTTHQTVRLQQKFIPDTRITTTTGELIEGVVEPGGDPGFILIRTSLSQTRLLPADSIRKREPITPDL